MYKRLPKIRAMDMADWGSIVTRLPFFKTNKTAMLLLVYISGG